jgi:outer membrane protein TolC
MERNMARKLLLIVFLMGGFFVAPAGISLAGPAAKDTLSSLIEEARGHNPRIRAAQYRVSAAHARTALFRGVPDPMVEYEHNKILPSMLSMPGEKIRPMKMLSVSQEIPFPTRIYLRKKSAQKDEAAARQEYLETEQKVIRELKEAYYGLFLAQRKIAFTKDFLNLMGQFVEVTSKRYEAGRSGQQDVLRAQVEHAKVANALVLYKKEARIAASLLLSILDRKDGDAVDIADAQTVQDLKLEEADIIELARKNRPELRSFGEMLARSEIENSLAGQAFFPDITLKYTRQEKDGKFSRLDEGEWTGMVGVKLPLWFWGRQIPEMKEARAELEAAKADYESAENAAVFDARSAFAKYEASRDLVKIYETGILPQASSAVSTARRAYESGGRGFLELLDSLRTLRELQVEYFESVAGLQISFAELEQSLGGHFEQQDRR